jgi:hypothetical protein
MSCNNFFTWATKSPETGLRATKLAPPSMISVGWYYATRMANRSMDRSIWARAQNLMVGPRVHYDLSFSALLQWGSRAWPIDVPTPMSYDDLLRWSAISWPGRLSFFSLFTPIQSMWNCGWILIATETGDRSASGPPLTHHLRATLIRGSDWLQYVTVSLINGTVMDLCSCRCTPVKGGRRRSCAWYRREILLAVLMDV